MNKKAKINWFFIIFLFVIILAGVSVGPIIVKQLGDNLNNSLQEANVTTSSNSFSSDVFSLVPIIFAISIGVIVISLVVQALKPLGVISYSSDNKDEDEEEDEEELETCPNCEKKVESVDYECDYCGRECCDECMIECEDCEENFCSQKCLDKHDCEYADEEEDGEDEEPPKTEAEEKPKKEVEVKDKDIPKSKLKEKELIKSEFD